MVHESKPKPTPRKKPVEKREVHVHSDRYSADYELAANTDYQAIERVITEQLIPLRDYGAIKGVVEVRCGGCRRMMRA